MVNKDLLKSWNKKFGEGSVTVGVESVRDRGVFSLGSPALDFMIYNSLPQDTFIEFSGLEHSGKTTLSFLVAADYIRKEKQHKEDDPNYTPRAILYMDIENTADEQWSLASTGYNMNDEEVETIRVAPSGQSAEEYFDMVIEAIKTGDFGLVIFDSLTAIVKGQIVDSSMEKMDMGGIAKPLGDFTKKAIGLLRRYHCSFIGINGLTANMSGYGQAYVTPGGTTWKRMCSVRIQCKKGELFDENGDMLKSTASNPAGHIIEAFLIKSKVCRSDRRLAYVHLNYVNGIDLLWDLSEVATVVGLIDSPAQGSFRFIDPDTGEVLKDNNGTEIKIRGKKNIKPYLLEHKDLWKRISEKVAEISARKQDTNVKSFEEMLNIDVNEHFSVSAEEMNEE